MNHEEFVQAYRGGLAKVHVDREAAGHLYAEPGLLPTDIRLRHAVVRLIGWLFMIAAVAVLFYAAWDLAAAAAIGGLVILSQSPRDAADGVLWGALRSPLLYELARARNILRVEPR
jgi:hypothetical protein